MFTLARVAIARRHWADIASYALLLGMSVFALVPIFWGFLTSIKRADEVIVYPPTLLPRAITLENYAEVLLRSPLPLFFRNSVVVAVAAIALSLAVAVPMAYAAVRFRFRMKNALMFLILSTAMIPGISVLVPLYLLAVESTLHDTLLVLVLVYAAWQVPQVVWLLRGFLETIPPEIEEAALTDGCSRLGALVRVVLPMCRPGLAAASIIVFVLVWNDWLIATTLTSSESLRLAQVGLYRITRDPHGISWGVFMAYTMLVLMPVLGAFALLQRRFIAALAGGAVKG
jgi:ABC-type glycerol-3-phosphate transport system permease component